MESTLCCLALQSVIFHFPTFCVNNLTVEKLSSIKYQYVWPLLAEKWATVSLSTAHLIALHKTSFFRTKKKSICSKPISNLSSLQKFTVDNFYTSTYYTVYCNFHAKIDLSKKSFNSILK